MGITRNIIRFAGVAATIIGGTLSMPASAALVGIDIGYATVQQQTAPNTLELVGAFFGARAFQANAGDFNSGILSGPGGTLPQALTPFGNNLFYTTSYLENQAALDAAFPIGDYGFSVSNTVTLDTQADQLTRTSALLIPTDAPVFSNFSALSAIDPSQNFNLQLTSGFSADPFASSAFTFVIVRDSLTFATVFSALFASPDTVNFVMPANSLTSGNSYFLEASFENRIQGSSLLSGLPTFQLFSSRTVANFTVPASAIVPEPASWAMMIMGFGLVGSMMRRRSDKAAQA